MKPYNAPLAEVLHAWPRLRSRFHGQKQISEAQLLTGFTQLVSAVAPAIWPTIRQELLRNELLYEVGGNCFSFEAPLVTSAPGTMLETAWLGVWQQLQAHLVLPLGCLWSTQWLHPYLPDLPDLLVVEVSWAEVNYARQVLENHQAEAAVATTSALCSVLVRAWRPSAPVRRVKGIPTARPEKMLVDVGQIPELAPFASEAALKSALTALHASGGLNMDRLRRYAVACQLSEQWNT
ncbi:DUF6577 family protein [Hymenobacter chitinivorans]|uniref:Uncharacterized protein n=1 Tax=Hymenobacter chitinivorans DSM 11115 TaxID=1121954 RepID=A0A2M9BAH1_9BACT|nr:DUF6577 family protein [Hymenobacter chitinivorans]PJJ54950.1 hypothetical protein CLV45_3297 [Hymenobacter chitinivorans DSM 11115]